MIVNNNLRYKPEGTLSQDSKGKTSQDVAFRGSNTQTPISVTDTRVEIPAQWFRTHVVFYNAGSGDIYIGDDTVTGANGIPISAGEKIQITMGSDLPLYAISGNAGGEELRVWEMG